jgi:hypothetical protein
LYKFFYIKFGFQNLVLDPDPFRNTAGAVLFFSLKYFLKIKSLVFPRAGIEGTLGHCERFGVGRQQAALQRRNGRHCQVK